MKEIKIIMIGIENEDDELYSLVQGGENAWYIINEDGEIIKAITKDIITDYCNKELEDQEIECVSAEIMIDNVWEEFKENYYPDIVDYVYTENWDKFHAWFDYTIVEYFTQEITAIYKQRLDDFE